MSDAALWDEKNREELRDRLQREILGQLRLSQRDPAAILEYCREVFIENECPENERADFIAYSTNELDRNMSLIDAEKAGWPETTDCDKLDRVESKLREIGILLWQLSPCCDTCSGSELGDRINAVDERYPGFRDTVRGYAFFIDQNMADQLSDTTEITVCLAYGWFSSDGQEVDPMTYETNALGIAREVSQCLHEEGIEVDWNGDFRRKVCISLNWQRRTLLW